MKELTCICFTIDELQDIDRLNKYLRQKGINDKNLASITKSIFDNFSYDLWYWKETK